MYPIPEEKHATEDGAIPEFYRAIPHKQLLVNLYIKNAVQGSGGYITFCSSVVHFEPLKIQRVN